MQKAADAVGEIIVSQAKWAAGSKETKQKDGIAAFEERQAAGFTKVAGKHIPADGLVSRRGQRRILPDGGPDLDWLEWREEQLEEIVKQTLHGRDATIFRRRVIENGSVEDLAREFNVTPHEIYKRTEKSKNRVIAAARKAFGKSEAANGQKDNERALQEAWGRVCAECGRPWILCWPDVCPPAKCWFFRHNNF